MEFTRCIWGRKGGKLEFGDVSGASGVRRYVGSLSVMVDRGGMLESPTGKEAPST